MSSDQKAFVAADALGPGGYVARLLESFEPRPQQMEMAQAVWEHLENRRHLVVEAGTGVGKSFAYLVPAIEQACRNKLRILVSTFTITLQEQLINKDLPFLAQAVPAQFDAVLAKGRNNYLCRRRLEFAQRRMAGLFDTFSGELDALVAWAARTGDGSLSDLSSMPSPALWDAVKSDRGSCRGRMCPHYRGCFYARAIRRWQTADIIVANHALLLSDLTLKEAGFQVLPDYRYVIVDEAHNLEHVAEDHFGQSITDSSVDYLLSRLYNPRTHRGLLSLNSNATGVLKLVASCHRRAKDFFRSLQEWYETEGAGRNGRWEGDIACDVLSDRLRDLRLRLTNLARECGDDDERFEYNSVAVRLEELETQLRRFVAGPGDDCVHWVETEGRARKRVILRIAPLNVGPHIRKHLFEAVDCVVLTSATLSVDGSDAAGGFDFFAGRVGLTDYDAVKLGSPFDYSRQVTMYIERGLPEPNESDFEEAAAKAVRKYIEKTGGSAFVLFTSYAMLSAFAERMKDWLARRNIRLLQQGTGTDRSQLLRQFRQDKASVLFGTDSFWQGVDVPGDALSNVIIVRLPFAVPNHPLVQGRIERILAEGGNPFYDFQIPAAVIKFKQGFGRLIRTKTDTGIVVVLDSRIVTKPYGRMFLQAVPKCRVKIVCEERESQSSQE